MDCRYGKFLIGKDNGKFDENLKEVIARRSNET